MATKLKKRKMKKARNLTVLDMLVTRKGGRMKNRNEKRKNNKNEQRELIDEAHED